MPDGDKVYKDTKGKPPVYQGLVQYFPAALWEVARASEFGADKYSLHYEDREFRAIPPDVLLDAALRHVGAHTQHAINHEDGGLWHLAQAAWNILAALQTEIESMPPEKVVVSPKF